MVVFPVFATDYEVEVDSTFDAGTPSGGNYYIRTQVNQKVSEWNPGDRAVIVQNGKKHYYTYQSNGNFVLTNVSGGIGGGSGGGYRDPSSRRCGLYEVCFRP